MKPKIRLLFDECVGKPLVERLAQDLSTDEIEIKHILDFQGQGIKDQDWLPRIADDKRVAWIVITGDQGRKSTPADKLPSICQVLEITHVMLSSTIHTSDSATKEAAIRAVWPQLVSLADTAPKGSAWVIRRAGTPPHDPVLVRKPQPRPGRKKK